MNLGDRWFLTNDNRIARKLHQMKSGKQGLSLAAKLLDILGDLSGGERLHDLGSLVRIVGSKTEILLRKVELAGAIDENVLLLADDGRSRDVVGGGIDVLCRRDRVGVGRRYDQPRLQPAALAIVVAHQIGDGRAAGAEIDFP